MKHEAQQVDVMTWRKIEVGKVGRWCGHRFRRVLPEVVTQQGLDFVEVEYVIGIDAIKANTRGLIEADDQCDVEVEDADAAQA